MKTKICTKCDKEKELSEFYSHARQKSGFSSQCKLCVNQYFIDNKEKVKKYKHKWYLKNKNKHNKSSRCYYEENKGKMKKLQLSYQKKRRKEDASFRFLCALRTRINTSIKKRYKSLSTMFLIECEIDYLMYHIQNHFTSGMSWDNYGRGGWEIDHIKPCSKFDLSKESEQRKCFHYTNLQPLWAMDNLKKKDKYE